MDKGLAEEFVYGRTFKNDIAHTHRRLST